MPSELQPAVLAAEALGSANGDLRRPVDGPVAVGCAAYLGALNALILNVQPLILGALATGYRLTDRELGYVTAVLLGFNTAAIAVGPLWVRRVDWRVASLVGVAGATACFGAGAFFGQLPALLVLFALIGITEGVALVPAFASLGDTRNPDRSYAVSTILQGVTAAAMAAPLSAWIIPQYGARGLFITLAIVMATGFAASVGLPPSGRVAGAATSERVGASIFSAAAIAPSIALLALAASGGGVGAFWFFVERIGAARGVAPGVIGLTLSVTALSSILTSGAVAWLGGRVPSLLIVAGGVATMLLGYAALGLAPTFGFVISNLLFALGWGFSTPAFWAVLRRVDATNRLFVAAGAASGLAAAAVGVAAGPIIEWGGYPGLIGFSAVLLGASVALSALAVWLAPRLAGGSHGLAAAELAS